MASLSRRTFIAAMLAAAAGPVIAAPATRVPMPPSDGPWVGRMIDAHGRTIAWIDATGRVVPA